MAQSGLLAPGQHSTGGKMRMGRAGKMGQFDMRRLLVCGAMALIFAATRKGIDPNSWLARLLARMLRKKAAIAIANKMARIIWAVVARRRNTGGGSGRRCLMSRPGTDFAEGVPSEADSGEFLMSEPLLFSNCYEVGLSSYSA